MQPIRRARLVDETAAQIRDAIARGRLQPGTRIVQEDLAAQLGVSRTPLRDALQKLAYEGLIVEAKGRGLEVRQTLADAIDLYEVREVIDGLAARLAAERATEDDLDKLAAAIEDMAPAGRFDAGAWLGAHVRFHEAIIAAAHNPVLEQVLKLTLQAVRGAYPASFVTRARAAKEVREHRDLLRAVRARDAERAETLGRRHIATTTKKLKSERGPRGRSALSRTSRARASGE